MSNLNGAFAGQPTAGGGVGGGPGGMSGLGGLSNMSIQNLDRNQI